MRYTPNRSRGPSDGDWSSDIARALSRRLVGQPAAIEAVVPYVEMYRAKLTPEGRPAGIFLLLGPTGTGKTKTVEALADVLHGSPKKLLKVDCGEYQMEHEVAKLLGAPPGYLGHRETQPLLTQQKLTGTASESCDLSILLFDEIEKAAQSLLRLLLGVLDKATLRLGDSTLVNFEKTIIFLTSNLGARDMSRELNPEFGFESFLPPEDWDKDDKLERIGRNAVRKNFSPEFLNRIDSVVTYRPLDAAALTAILDQQIEDLQDHIDRRLGERAFRIEVPVRARKFLLEKGTSPEYGARELKRVLHHQLMRPLASMVVGGEINPGFRVRAEVGPCKGKLVLRTMDDGELLRLANAPGSLRGDTDRVSGTLYVVATPIGNLEDITLRALRILREVDQIACEDTRQTRKLLDRHGISKSLVSYHEHNEQARAEELLRDLEAGKNIALVSDAGTPLIADPGYRLVAQARAHGVMVSPIPGPSALVSALSASGLPTDSFCFGGFLPAKKTQRRKTLEEMKEYPATLVFYETPHRILEALEDIAEVLGPRRVTIARELTKIHEEFLAGEVSELRETLEKRPSIKGEITLMIAKAEAQIAETIPMEAVFDQLVKAGVPRMEAMKKVARDRGLSKREVYQKLNER